MHMVDWFTLKTYRYHEDDKNTVTWTLELWQCPGTRLLPISTHCNWNVISWAMSRNLNSSHSIIPSGGPGSAAGHCPTLIIMGSESYQLTDDDNCWTGGLDCCYFCTWPRPTKQIREGSHGNFAYTQLQSFYQSHHHCLITVMEWDDDVTWFVELMIWVATHSRRSIRWSRLMCQRQLLPKPPAMGVRHIAYPLATTGMLLWLSKMGSFVPWLTGLSALRRGNLHSHRIAKINMTMHRR